MKTIQQGDTYKEGGFKHSVITRYNDIVLIKKQKDLGSISWEVIRIQKHKEFTIAGKTIPAGEHTPRSEDWGTHGWSYTTFDAAQKKYKELSGDTNVIGKG